MNKQVEELVEQATLYAVSDNSSKVFDTWKKRLVQKLVELIVQRCITIMLKEAKWYRYKNEFKSSEAIRNSVRRVEEHFKS
jgi:hypothetical protein